MQAGYRADQVRIKGEYDDYARVSDEADRREGVFHFCPTCGANVFITGPDTPDEVIVAAGAFADPSFPPPTESEYDSRRHPWVGLPDTVRAFAVELWDPVRPVYAAGRFAEAAAMGRELVAARSDQPALFYNLACCESLAGETTAAVEHLRLAVEMWDGCRDMARSDTDFDPVRGDDAFRRLVG